MMDTRTRTRLLGKVRALLHLLEGHYGALPKGADYVEILREGISAALTLGLPLVARQQARRQRQASEAVRVALEVYAGTVEVGRVERTDADEPISVPSCWPVEGEQWGIGRGIPTGDVQ